MSGASTVVAWEYRGELNNAIVICLLNPSKGCVVQVGGIVGVAVVGLLNTGVYAGRVAAPNIGPWRYKSAESMTVAGSGLFP